MFFNKIARFENILLLFLSTMFRPLSELWSIYGQKKFEDFEHYPGRTYAFDNIAKDWIFWEKRAIIDLGITKEEFYLLRKEDAIETYKKLRDRVYIDKFALPLFTVTLLSLGWKGINHPFPIAFKNNEAYEAYFVYKNKPNVSEIKKLLKKIINNVETSSPELKNYIMTQDFANFDSLKNDRNYQRIAPDGKIIEFKDNTAYTGKTMTDLSHPTIYNYLKDLYEIASNFETIFYLNDILPLLVNALHDIEQRGYRVKGIRLDSFSTNTANALFGLKRYSGNILDLPL